MITEHLGYLRAQMNLKHPRGEGEAREVFLENGSNGNGAALFAEWGIKSGTR